MFIKNILFWESNPLTFLLLGSMLGPPGQARPAADGSRVGLSVCSSECLGDREGHYVETLL